jgi:hypothetical protein
MTEADAEELRAALLDAAVACDASTAGADEYGRRFVIDFTLVMWDVQLWSGRLGLCAPVRISRG